MDLSLNPGRIGESVKESPVSGDYEVEIDTIT